MSKLAVDILYAHSDDIKALPEDQETVVFGNLAVKGWSREDAVRREDKFRREIIITNKGLDTKGGNTVQ